MKFPTWLSRVCAVWLVFMLVSSATMPAFAEQPQTRLLSAYDVIDAVNQIRASNGLPAYQINGSLMASAQAHSDYQASIGQVTHTGQGSSNAKSRAIAAGYGGGATVFISENIYGGSNASAQGAVNWWMGDALHQNTMLSPNYTDAGAGVASNGGATYFTLDVGYMAGSPGSGGTGSTAGPAVLGTSMAFIPVQISTPAPDGSIVHVVQSGQSLWTIAAAYKVGLPEILQLNKMTATTTIYPGNKILVKTAAATATLTPTETNSSPRVTFTKRPGRTRTPIPTRSEAERSPTPVSGDTAVSNTSSKSESEFTDPLLIIIIALVGGGAALTVVGILIQRRN